MVYMRLKHWWPSLSGENKSLSREVGRLSTTIHGLRRTILQLTRLMISMPRTNAMVGNYTGITLLKKRSRHGKFKYLVSWKGRSRTEDSWIEDSKISMCLIEEWEKNETTSFRKTIKGRRNMNPRTSRGGR